MSNEGSSDEQEPNSAVAIAATTAMIIPEILIMIGELDVILQIYDLYLLETTSWNALTNMAFYFYRLISIARRIIITSKLKCSLSKHDVMTVPD